MPCLVIITGASRGLGRALALSLARSLTTDLDIRLTASPASIAQLAALSSEIKELRASFHHATMVECLTADLSDVAGLHGFASLLFSRPREIVFSQVIFVNNHGSLGDLAPVGTHDALRMHTAINVNVTSTCFLSSEAVKFAKSLPPSTAVQIINISSLCALQPFPSWAIYCAGKAARDMYHRTLAEELKDTSTKTLNYAPGPLDTDMQRQIREGADVHEPTRKVFVDLKEQGKLVSPEASAEKLVMLIVENAYESGAHLDYYDL